jgi:hypothetical protein
MFELLRSPKTRGGIQAPPTTLLFLTGSNLSSPSLNHAPQVFVTPLFWGVVWDALTLPLTLKLHRQCLRSRLHLHSSKAADSPGGGER